jgi:predicted nuclease of predicted toxin-antitoxin system
LARFLVDESLPRAVARALTAAGHEALDVRDAGLRGHSDDDVFARAKLEERLLLTADLDFANALRFPPGTHPGIVVLRVPDDWSAAERAERLTAALREVGADQLRGAVSSVEPDEVRGLSQEPLVPVEQVATHLLHPLARRVHHDPADLNGAALDVHDEEHEVPHRTADAESLDREEIGRVECLPCAFRNAFQFRFLLRSGAGSTPASARMFATVVRLTSIFSPVRSASRSFV